MASFLDLGNLSNTSGVGALLALPNSSYPYFWAWILFGIWTVVSLSLYFAERIIKGFGNLLSSASVAAFAVMTLATVGTLVGFISLQIMIFTIVLGFTLIGVWFFSRS